MIFLNADEGERTTVVRLLPTLLLSLIPDFNGLIPDFDIFLEATTAITALIPQFNDLIDTFFKLLLDGSYDIFSQLNEYDSKSSLLKPVSTKYVSRILALVADCLDQKVDSKYFEQSLQMFWVALVIHTGGNLFSVFNAHEDMNNLKKLAMKISPYTTLAKGASFSEASILMVNIQGHLSAKIFLNNDEIIIVFKSVFPQVNASLLSTMKIGDAILLLSIFTLEKTRAMCLSFDYFLDYCDIDYNPNFDQTLDSMAEPIFHQFLLAVNKVIDFNERISAVDQLSITFLRCFLKNGSRRSKVTYKICPKFFKTNLMCIMSHEFMSTLVATSEFVDKAQQPIFRSIASDIISTSAKEAHPLLYSAACRIIISRADSNDTFCLPFFTDLIPQSQRNDFLEAYTQECILHGMGIDMPDDLSRFDNERKAQFITLQVIQSGDSSLIREIPKDVRLSTTLRCWSVIATSSFHLANELVDLLIANFISMVKHCRGLFSDVYNEIDIREQTAMLHFFSSLVRIQTFTDRLVPLVTVMKDKVVLKTAGAIIALIPLAYFLLSILHNKTTMEIARKNSIVFTITILLKVLSMRAIPDVYKFITFNNIKYLEGIIPMVSGLPNLIREGFEIPVNGKTSDVIIIENQLFMKFISVLAFALAQENMLFQIFVQPLSNHKTPTNLINQYWVKPKYFYVNELLPMLIALCPASVVSFVQILHAQDIFIAELPSLSNMFPYELATEPSLVPHLAKNCISLLSLASLIDPHFAITLVTPKLVQDKFSSNFVVRCLKNMNDDDALLIVPQLVQSIRFDKCYAIRNFMIEYASTHEIFAHRVLWVLLDEKDKSVSEEEFDYPMQLPVFENSIIEALSEEQQRRKDNEFALIDDLGDISKHLLTLKIEDRPQELKEQLLKLDIPEGIYVPSRPEYEILEVLPDSSKPLKSHARVPILVDFKVRDRSERVFNYSCIFKIHDDVRMDALMIQLIDKCDEICKASGIDIFLCPYKVFTTGPNRGVIECIENAYSRHDIGVQTNCCLLNYFTSKYGPIGSPAFNRAQQNFIKSLAPYSLICYLFQVKDRHNANIMFDNEGHIIHIDFGFIFDISPGGNIKFERAPFKLTREYIDLLGGSKDAAPFKQFVSLLTKCFVAIQARHKEIETIAELMVNAGLPCFRPDSFKKLRDRFALEKSASEIPVYVQSLVNGSYEAMTTTAYDTIQNSQNGIFYC